jgi:hypothetical protein
MRLEGFTDDGSAALTRLAIWPLRRRDGWAKAEFAERAKYLHIIVEAAFAQRMPGGLAGSVFADPQVTMSISAKGFRWSGEFSWPGNEITSQPPRHSGLRFPDEGEIQCLTTSRPIRPSTTFARQRAMASGSGPARRRPPSGRAN